MFKLFLNDYKKKKMFSNFENIKCFSTKLHSNIFVINSYFVIIRVISLFKINLFSEYLINEYYKY